MDTIVINNKTFVIKKCHESCDKCLFYHNSNYPSYPHYNYFCVKTKCYNFIVIREVNVIDKIKMWFKKKIKK